ncbi:hypothetical protein VSDG_04347 [Cytospora chrysosperma]|uniref:Zn(2)-C6 fungal-type domain-containing protein n=1 Tax=Cytospora chrysosperma TaxID=252740 RepID=A0A423W5L9_CYTCH|nr:hypothetical protein VSDG_04347 [Valsa sordida]
MSAPRYNEPARKRQRKTRSCEQCRNLKIKCDQELPACGACRRSREPLSCNYRDSDRLKDAAMAEMYPGGSNEGTVSTSSYTSIARHGHPEPPQGLPAYDETVRKLQERVHRLERFQVFNVQMALVLAIGVIFNCPKEANRDYDSLRRQAQQWIYAAQWWLAGPTEKTTQNLPALQSFCLLILARQVNGLGTSPSLSPASLLSMAMQMGLHRNSEMFPSLSHLQVECRARLWATVVELYLPSLLHNSMPTLVDLNTVDARAPSNINDSELTDGPITKAPPAPGDRTTDMSIQLLLLKTQNLRLRAIQVLGDVRLQTSYEAVVDLANQLRSACTEVAAFFQYRASHLDPETAFHWKYMDMYLRRHILLLHRPFMLQARKDPRFYLSRRMCLESSMIMASYADGLNLPFAEPDDFSRLMVHGSGHFRGGLSLDVIVTLAFELITQLQEDGPGRARGQPSYDPARELARAAREPIICRLEHIRGQLFQAIALGNPSLKRSGIISVLLAHIKALEAGENAKAALYDAIKECMEKCLGLLRGYLDAHTSRVQEPVDKMPGLLDGSEFDFEKLDLDALMDPMNLFNSPGSGGPFGGFGF